MTVTSVFQQCVHAIQRGELIERISRQDKEFHFQNWFSKRLGETGLCYEQGGRNSYPDYRMVHHPEGYELKALAYPGRYTSFDSNSQVPAGFHNGRTIYYVFGRYPKDVDGQSFPVLDLVICHGDFLNVDRDYTHENKSVKGFGSYGDIQIRDRKMYVVPTPYHLADGLAHRYTLILPADIDLSRDFAEVGTLRRVEAESVVVGYSFNLRTNELEPETAPNPAAGTEHAFRAWRVRGCSLEPVSMRDVPGPSSDADLDEEGTDV